MLLRAGVPLGERGTLGLVCGGSRIELSARGGALPPERLYPCAQALALAIPLLPGPLRRLGALVGVDELFPGEGEGLLERRGTSGEGLLAFGELAGAEFEPLLTCEERLFALL